MQKPATILQVLPALKSGGVERGTIEISTAIKRNGWRSLVASSGGPMVSGVAYSGGEHYQLPLKSKNPLKIIKNIKALAKIIRDEEVDIVHARSRAPAWSAYYAAKITGRPFVTTFHGVYGLKPPIKLHYNKVMTLGDRVIAVSRHIRDHIIENYPCDPLKIELIHRGADMSLFGPDQVTPGFLEELAKEWHLPDDPRPVILLPGRITRWKGHEFLICSLSQLKDHKFLCLLCGDAGGHPGYLEEMKTLIVELGMEEHIRFTPHTKYMTEAYALSDIVVVPSMEPEAFGRVPVEAQAMGKLVIATNHGGAMETIKHNETGFLVEPGDEDGMAEAMKVALEMSAEDRESMGYAGMQHIRENFSLDVMQHKTIELYKTLLS
ncbi:MAG: glycosyltransferase family 4 protein [Rickettsiales bacterium]|nr:glycosyltransferase family 4 protein [Rickettsiales bacterium]